MPYDILLLTDEEIEAYKKELLAKKQIDKKPYFIVQDENDRKIIVYRLMDDQISRHVLPVKDYGDLEQDDSLICKKLRVLTEGDAIARLASSGLFAGAQALDKSELARPRSPSELSKQTLFCQPENGGHEPLAPTTSKEAKGAIPGATPEL